MTLNSNHTVYIHIRPLYDLFPFSSVLNSVVLPPFVNHQGASHQFPFFSPQPSQTQWKMRIRKGRKKGDCCSFQSFDYFSKTDTHTDTHAGTNSRRRRETSVYRRAVDSFDTSYLFPQTFTNVERRTQMFSSAHSTIKKKGEKRRKKKQL